MNYFASTHATTILSAVFHFRQLRILSFKALFFILAFGALSAAGIALADGNPEWVRQAGAGSGKFSLANAVAADGSGNVYATGNTSGLITGATGSTSGVFIREV